MAVTIYGASDDLIEVEGAISEEFGGGDEPRYLAFSNGVVLKVVYDDEGVWRIAPRASRHLVTVEFARGEDEGNDSDGCPGYSDKAVIDSDVSWVLCGEDFKAVAR